MKHNQDKIHAETYQGLKDHLNNSDITPDIPQPKGRHIILPASFTAGPRYLKREYYDSMAIVCKFGKPDYFITFTCNPQWLDIINSLPAGITPSDKPDIVARVLKLKKEELLNDLNVKIYLVKSLNLCMLLSFKREDYLMLIFF